MADLPTRHDSGSLNRRRRRPFSFLSGSNGSVAVEVETPRVRAGIAAKSEILCGEREN